MEQLTRQQTLVGTLIQLCGVGVGLWIGTQKKHPIAGFLLGSFAGSAVTAFYIYFSTPPSAAETLAANPASGALPRAAT